jgi:ABC-type ATPase with predicted acetyltransferase domain
MGVYEIFWLDIGNKIHSRYYDAEAESDAKRYWAREFNPKTNDFLKIERKKQPEGHAEARRIFDKIALKKCEKCGESIDEYIKPDDPLWRKALIARL